jgi:hypothetical protein
MAWIRLIAALAVIAVGFGAVKAARAHCDGLDGPVVKAAQSDYSRGPPPILANPRHSVFPAPLARPNRGLCG